MWVWKGVWVNRFFSSLSCIFLTSVVVDGCLRIDRGRVVDGEGLGSFLFFGLCVFL